MTRPIQATLTAVPGKVTIERVGLPENRERIKSGLSMMRTLLNAPVIEAHTRQWLASDRNALKAALEWIARQEKQLETQEKHSDTDRSGTTD